MKKLLKVILAVILIVAIIYAAWALIGWAGAGANLGWAAGAEAGSIVTAGSGLGKVLGAGVKVAAVLKVAVLAIAIAALGLFALNKDHAERAIKSIGRGVESAFNKAKALLEGGVQTVDKGFKWLFWCSVAAVTLVGGVFVFKHMKE